MEGIEVVLDDQLVCTMLGGCQMFLVKWCNTLLYDCC
jgi:hypothetical protein